MSKHETNYQLTYRQMEAHERAVARGVKLLDRHVPGWWKEINLNTLELDNCDQCVVGQAVGGWEQRMASKLSSIRMFSSRYGFNFLNSYGSKEKLTDPLYDEILIVSDPEYVEAAYAYLEECWTRAVKDKFANSTI